jgi:hypothetical protein
MKYVGTAKRIVRKPDLSYWLWIPIYFSESDNTYHRILPDFLVPFKQYIAQTITDAANDNVDLDLYSLPSDSSRIRWKKLLYKLLPRKSEMERSDHSDSLPLKLHNNNINGSADNVSIGFVFHRFSTEEVACLLFLSTHKRL